MIDIDIYKMQLKDGDITKESLVSLYLNETITLSDIKSILECSDKTVTRLMNKSGLEYNRKTKRYYHPIVIQADKDKPIKPKQVEKTVKEIAPTIDITTEKRRLTILVDTNIHEILHRLKYKKYIKDINKYIEKAVLEQLNKDSKDVTKYIEKSVLEQLNKNRLLD